MVPDLAKRSLTLELEEICPRHNFELLGAFCRRGVQSRQEARVSFITSQNPLTTWTALDGHKVLNATTLDSQANIGGPLKATDDGARTDSADDLLELAPNRGSSARWMHVVETRVPLLCRCNRQPSTAVSAVSSLNTCFSPAERRRLLEDGSTQGVHCAHGSILFVELLQDEKRLSRIRSCRLQNKPQQKGDQTDCLQDQCCLDELVHILHSTTL